MNLSIVRCLTLAAVTAAAGITAVALAQTPPQQPPATRPAGTQPGGRSFDAVRADLEAVGQQLQPLMADARIFTDPAVRKETGEKAVPLLRRLVNLMGEAAATAPIPQMADQIRLGQYQVRGLLMGFGEAQAKAELEQDASPTAKAALATGTFIAGEDQAARSQAVTQLATLAEQHPEDLAVARAAMDMWQMTTDAELKKQIRAVVDEKLKGMPAEQLREVFAAAAEEEKAVVEFRDKFMNKPLTVEGQTLKGESLSTASLKGKVVLVDFWATWCPPCIAALPKVKEDYRKYHDQGFEIVAVSLDRSAEPLKAFLAENPEMTWPQIFTEADPQASAKIAEGLGIQAIPTVFLLDKNGVVRGMAIGGGEEMEKLHTMIPELLKEQPGAASPTTQPGQQ